MKKLIVASALLCALFSSISLAQHSLQLDVGGGRYGILQGDPAWPVGVTTFTFPPGGGTVVTTVTLPTLAWVLNGNMLSGGSPATPTQVFGSNNDFDVIFRRNTIERLRFGTTHADFTTNIRPTADNTYTLGTDANRWADLYVNGGSVHIGLTGGEGLNTELNLGYAANVGTINANGGTAEIQIDGANGRVGIGLANPGTLFANTNANITDQGGDGLNGSSISWQVNAGGYVAGLENLNNVAVNPHGLLVKTAATTANTRVLDVMAGGLDIFQVLGNSNVNAMGNVTLGNAATDAHTINGAFDANDNGNIIGDGSTNSQLRIEGAAGDATLASTIAGNPTHFDLAVIGDIGATGIIKSGASITIDGVSATRAITSDAAMNIVTTAGDIVLNAATNIVSTNDNINPALTDVQALGTVALRWDLFADNVNANSITLPVGSYPDNAVFYSNGGAFAAEAAFNYDDALNILAVEDLDITAAMNFPVTSSATVGVISQSGLRFLHSFSTNSVFLGTESGNFTMTGTQNTGVGRWTLRSVTTGTNNVAFGFNAGQAITSATQNTAIGAQALFNTNTGGSNTAVGLSAMFTNTSGTNNVGVGRDALSNSSTASNNTAVGSLSLLNTTVGDLTAVGFEALRENTTGTSNSAFGYLALRNNTTGPNNTALGNNALGANTTGNTNTAVGSRALDANTTGNSNTAIGFDALTSSVTASGNTAVGYQALQTNSTGNENTAIGTNSMAVTTTGSANTAVGNATLLVNSTGGGNVAVGDLAMTANTTGSQNTAVGRSSMVSNTTGGDNTAMGIDALHDNTTSNGNTAMGNRALLATTGASNTAIGSNAGDVNVAGSDNTFVGANSDAAAAGLTNATAIGANATVSASNTMQLGAAAVTDVISSGHLTMTQANSALTFTGDAAGVTTFTAGNQGATTITYTLPTAQATAAGQVLANDGTGILSWATNGAVVTHTTTSPAALAVNTNDYALVSATATHYRVSSTGAVNVTGIVAAADGRVIILTNIGANNITLTHLDAGSAAANQFRLPGGFNITLGQDGTATLIYDATTANWRLVSTN